MPARPGPSHLLVSDLDDTLLGDDASLARFRAFCDGHRDLLGVVYASGRFCASIQDRIEHTDLPEPLATIGGVGSEIWSYPDRVPVRAWWERIGARWSADEVRRLLGDVPGLAPQPASSQSPYKVSYYLEDADADALARIRRRLDEAGVGAHLVYSSGRDLDVLPDGVDKGTAAAWLAETLGFAADAVLGAGNSLNDAALMDHGFAGIVVGNAHADLKARADGRRVYVADGTFADGVVEGVRHWLEVMAS